MGRAGGRVGGGHLAGLLWWRSSPCLPICGRRPRGRRGPEPLLADVRGHGLPSGGGGPAQHCEGCRGPFQARAGPPGCVAQCRLAPLPGARALRRCQAGPAAVFALGPQSTLVLDSLRLATEVLAPKGAFVTKIFRRGRAPVAQKVEHSVFTRSFFLSGGAGAGAGAGFGAESQPGGAGVGLVPGRALAAGTVEPSACRACRGQHPPARRSKDYTALLYAFNQLFEKVGGDACSQLLLRDGLRPPCPSRLHARPAHRPSLETLLLSTSHPCLLRPPRRTSRPSPLTLALPPSHMPSLPLPRWRPPSPRPAATPRPRSSLSV
jgi:hypothetical protein